MSNKVRVAVVGPGNCASSLIQGVHYYRDADADDTIPGLMHVKLGDYHVNDIEFVAAFDVDEEKVGKDLSEAIFSGQNNTYKFSDVPFMDVPVQRGPTMDGLGKYLKEVITESDEPVASVADVLRETKTDVIVLYLPVGSEEAIRWYIEQALEAGVAVVNAIPVFIASDPYWQLRFCNAAFPLSATTSRARLGQPSPTACSPACSKTEVFASTAPTSSTSVATPTS